MPETSPQLLHWTGSICILISRYLLNVLWYQVSDWSYIWKFSFPTPHVILMCTNFCTGWLLWRCMKIFLECFMVHWLHEVQFKAGVWNIAGRLKIKLILKTICSIELMFSNGWGICWIILRAQSWGSILSRISFSLD